MGDSGPDARFAPATCPECGYALRGLAAEGVCPECGAGYHPSHLVLFGWAGPTRSNLSNSPTGPAIAGAIAAGACFLCLAFLYRGRLGWEGIAAAALVGAVMTGIVVRRWSFGTPPVQVRLQAHGVAQRDGVGPVVLEPWEGRWELHLLPGGGGRRRLILHRLKGERWTTVLQLVDLEFDCDEKAAGELCRRVRAFVAAAGGEIRIVDG